MIRHVQYGIDTLRPWYYPRPETGSTRNFAVRFRAQFANKADYLRSIWLPRLGSDHYTVKSFQYSFPKLPKNATKAQICDFLHRLCRHGVGYGVYVPPFATMTHANHTGLWYPDLPIHCRDHWEFYDQVLHQALTSSSANLNDSDLTRPLLSEFSGYQIIWLLAHLAGHPGVAYTLEQISMPRQRRDLSLHDYMQQWTHFLHLEHTRGVAYSDVYFVETWLEHLHSTLNDTVKPLILGLLRDCPRNEPVPIHFSPEHLLSFICSRMRSVGIYNLSPLTTPAMLTSSSRRPNHGNSPAPIRQLTDGSSFVDVRLIDEELPADIFASVCSLMASGSTRTCDLCQESTHMVASCPILHRVLPDPDKARRLLSLLQSQASSRGGHTTPRSGNDRARTPPVSNRGRGPTAPQRAIDQGDDTDEDIDPGSLTDGETDDPPTDFH